MNLTIRPAAQTAAALVIAAAFVLQSPAQQGSSTTRRPGRGGAPDPVRAELEREMMLRELEEGGSRKPAERQAPQHIFARMSEDFMRIQIVNNELVRAASRAEALDLKFVAKSASEIKKRAQRLKSDMVLPEPDKVPKRPKQEAAEEEQLKSSLLTLGKLIAGFAHNPVFKEPNVVDAQLSAKARRDLEDIIELTGQVMKSSEKLGKSVNKTQ